MRLSVRAGGAHVALAAALCLGLVLPSAPATADDPLSTLVDDIVTVVTRVLSTAEVAALDITNTAQGAADLSDASAGGFDVDSSPFSVYQYGDSTLIAPTGADVLAYDGENAEGQTVSMLTTTATGVADTTDPGLAVPPTSAFQYNNSNSFQYTTGGWIRKVWWVIDSARWRPNTTSAYRNYWRLTSKMSGGLTDPSASDYTRMWLELDRTSSGTYSEFEPPTPAQSVPGQADTSTTVGYSRSATVELGDAPVKIGATVDNSYQGTLSSSSEWLHPVLRTEIGSGGSQWCKYSGYFGGTKMITNRISLSASTSTTPPGWDFLHGMSLNHDRCPDV